MTLYWVSGPLNNCIIQTFIVSAIKILELSFYKWKMLNKWLTDLCSRDKQYDDNNDWMEQYIFFSKLLVPLCNLVAPLGEILHLAKREKIKCFIAFLFYLFFQYLIIKRRYVYRFQSKFTSVWFDCKNLSKFVFKW